MTLQRLTALLGVDEQEAARLLPVCSAAAAELTAKLKCGAKDRCDERLIAAAAALAYYRTVAMRCANDGAVSSFRAGDVAVSTSSSDLLKLAAAIRDDALACVADLLEDEFFVFRQVTG